MTSAPAPEPPADRLHDDDARAPYSAPIPLGQLARALSRAQVAFPPVTKSKVVKIPTSKGSYTYNYAPLDVVFDAIRKPLADNGLAVSQLLGDDELITLLLHECGASLESRVKLPKTNDIKELGSVITYLRRYSLQAILGIATEDDDADERDTRASRTGTTVKHGDDTLTKEQAAANAAQAKTAPVERYTPVDINDRKQLSITALQTAVLKLASDPHRHGRAVLNDDQRRLYRAQVGECLTLCCAPHGDAHALIPVVLFAVTQSRFNTLDELPDPYLLALRDWLRPTSVPDAGGYWPADAVSTFEVGAVLIAAAEKS